MRAMSSEMNIVCGENQIFRISVVYSENYWSAFSYSRTACTHKFDIVLSKISLISALEKVCHGRKAVRNENCKSTLWFIDFIVP